MGFRSKKGILGATSYSSILAHEVVQKADFMGKSPRLEIYINAIRTYLSRGNMRALFGAIGLNSSATILSRRPECGGECPMFNLD